MRHLHADVAGGDLLHGVGLVENNEVIREKKPASAVLRILHRIEECEKQGVIEDDHFGVGHAAAQVLIKTSASRAACLRGAEVLLAANLLPHGGIRLLQKIAQGAVLRLHAPFPNALQLGMLGRGEQFLRLIQRAGEARGAQIILPPLQQHRLELIGDDLLHEWNVLKHELLLQRDRMGADHRLALRPHRMERRRHQVGKGFSNARARLDHHVTTGLDRPRNGPRHALLLGAVFKRGRSREDAGFRKNSFHLALERRGRANLKILSDRNHRDILETHEPESRPPRHTSAWPRAIFQQSAW